MVGGARERCEAGVVQRGEQRARAQAFGQLHRDDVVGAGERLAQPDRAAELAVVVLG